MRARRRRSRREERLRARRIRRRCALALAAALLASLAMTPGLREKLAGAFQSGREAAETFAAPSAGEAEITLPEREIFALQLGVYDSGESAAAEQRRIAASGVPCVLWQRERMRIVCGAAFSRAALDASLAGECEHCVVSDTMPEVRLRFSGEQKDAQSAAALFAEPDRILEELIRGEPLEDVLTRTERTAREALGAQAGHALHTQLAQSLVNWCALVRETQAQEERRRGYAAATMATLCRELRLTLLKEAEGS